MALSSRNAPNAPIIYYLPHRYRLVAAFGGFCTTLWVAYGITQSQPASIAGGLLGVLIVALFTLSAIDKFRGGIALAREGSLLVGGELARPLSVSETTFEIVPDHQGSWVIVLYSRGKSIRLGTGGWRVQGERFVTRKVAERTLLALGLQHRTH